MQTKGKMREGSMKKRHGKAALAWTLVLCTAAGSAKIDAQAAGSQAAVSIGNDMVSIGNDYISREYSIADGHIKTAQIVNKRIGTNLVPQDGSQDFVINTLGEADTAEPGTPSEDTDKITNEPQWELSTPDAISKEGWSAKLTNSAGTEFPESAVNTLFDNELGSYPNEYTISGHPFTLDIDLGETRTIASMSVNKRPGYPDSNYGTNGTMGGYEIRTSADGVTYDNEVAKGEFTEADYNLHQEGDLYNVGDLVYANFGHAVDARYVRVVQTSVAIGSAEEFTSAEIGFYTGTFEKTQKIVEPTEALDRSAWKVTITNNGGQVFDDAHTARLIDGDPNTNPDEYTKAGSPFTVDIDLGSVQTVSSLSIDKRPGYSDANYGLNGTMGKFKLYVSEDGTNYTFAGAGEFTKEAYNLHEENGLYNVGDRVYANFKKTYTTRYVRLVQESCSMGSSDEFTSAELNLYADQYVGPNWNTDEESPDITPPASKTIKAGELVFESAEQADIDGGKKLTIHYAPYTVNGVNYDIDQVAVLMNDEHYMNTYLEIGVSDKDKAQIDYIDMDRFVLPGDAKGVWSHPDESKISSMWIGGHELMLGQPIYANGLFMGSEFPAADTRISDNTTEIRYYSGKTFTRLDQDNQLQADGTFRTWWNVVGAARGTDTAVVQTDFFSYIEDIATPTEFRKQYNSWYDNMMNITDESIAASFYGAEKGLTQNGVEPLDSYVVDDGWNNYYDGTYTATPGSAQGTTPNVTGFWEFNAKFPNELYTSSALSDKFQSTFGLWLGPQGGYNYFQTFGPYLESRGTGYAQDAKNGGGSWTNICVGSDKYVKNLQSLFIDYENRFNIDYWKWDGFALRPCTNASHDHMTGGNQNMYFTSDLWEKWTDLFEAAREARAKEGKGLFINATCYVNLSPWLLQWVNTIWVQDSGDTGQLGSGERHQQKIYYRDQVYYQLYRQNQIQFPLKNIYNHDPIYGVSDNSKATTEVFREFLFANAVRGTAFWELYYSPSIMDDAKWKVTTDALAWAEENHEILKNAKLFGNQPKNGVYGYSSWNGTEGIISFTNPLDSEQTYSLQVNNTIGADPALKNAKGVQVQPYEAGELKALSYGDTITVTLKPHETVIQQYGSKDAEAPKLVSAKSTGDQELTLKFDERIQGGTFTVNGKKAKAEVKEDYRTVVLTTDKLPEGEVKVGVQKVSDVNGNATSADVTVACYKDGVIAEVAARTDVKGKNNIKTTYDAETETTWLGGVTDSLQVKTDNQLTGTTDFSIVTGVKTTAAGTTLVTAGDDVKLSINKDGFVEFKVGSLTLTSEEKVTTVDSKATGTFGTDEYQPTKATTVTKGQVNDGQAHSIAAVREANGILKIYIDGALAASAYDANVINENLKGGAITIGGAGYTGDLAAVQVLNRAVAYDETSAIQPKPPVVEENSREGWTASACSEMPGMSGDASAMAAIDGNTGSWWHTNYLGGDTCSGKHWIAVDFGKEETFDHFLYTGRGAGSNGSIKDYILEIKNADGTYTTIKEGSFSADNAADTVDLGKEYKGYGFRLTAVSTHNGQNFAAAVEMNIGLTKKSEQVTAPAITEGDGSQWKKGDLTFKTDAKDDTVLGIYVDDEEISKDSYTVKNGVITLTEAYLKTLSKGSHTMTLVTRNGEATADFEVLSGSAVINPGDNKPGDNKPGDNKPGNDNTGNTKPGNNSTDSTTGSSNGSGSHKGSGSSGKSNTQSTNAAATGDTAPIAVWAMLLLAAGCGCAVVYTKRKKNS